MRSLIPDLSPLPSPEQYELLVKAKNGDKQARDRLVLTNQKLVHEQAHYYVRKFDIGALEREDFVQAGMAALLESIDKFNLKYSNAFTTYATYRIRDRLNELIEQSLPMRVSIEVYRKVPRQRMVQLQNPVSLSGADRLPSHPNLTEASEPPDFYNVELLHTALAVKGLLTEKQKELLWSWAGVGVGKRVGITSIKGAMTRLRWYLTNVPTMREG